MKASYITPRILTVSLSDADIITTSDPEVCNAYSDTNQLNLGRERRNPIWDED